MVVAISPVLRVTPPVQQEPPAEIAPPPTQQPEDTYEAPQRDEREDKQIRTYLGSALPKTEVDATMTELANAASLDPQAKAKVIEKLRDADTLAPYGRMKKSSPRQFESWRREVAAKDPEGARAMTKYFGDVSRGTGTEDERKLAVQAIDRAEAARAKSRWERITPELKTVLPAAKDQRELREQVATVKDASLQDRRALLGKLDALDRDARAVRETRKALNGPRGEELKTQIATTYEIMDGPERGAAEANKLISTVTGATPATAPVGPELRKYAAYEEKVAHPERLNKAQRERYTGELSTRIHDAEKQLTDKLAPITGENLGFFKYETEELLNGLHTKVADFDAKKEEAIRNPAKMKQLLASANAVQDDLRTFPSRWDGAVRAKKEQVADRFGDVVIKEPRTARIGDTAAGNARAEELKTVVPELERRRDEYRATKSPEKLDAYFEYSVKAFSDGMDSTARASNELGERAETYGKWINVCRTVRNGSIAVGAMLIPGAQGVSLASGTAAVASLAALKTTFEAADGSLGSNPTAGGIAQRFATNTLHAGTDAAVGLGTLKLTKEAIVAGSAVRELVVAGRGGVMSAGSGAAHRLIDGDVAGATNPKNVLVDGAVGAVSIGGVTKLAPLMERASPLVRQGANLVIGGGTAGGAKLATNALEGKPLDQDLVPTIALGGGMSLAAGVATSGTPKVRRGSVEVDLAENAVPFTNANEVPGGPGGVRERGLPGRYILTDEMNPKSLPYSSSIRPASTEPIRLPKTLDEVPRVQPIVDETMILTNSSHGGSAGVVRLAKLPDGRPVAVKSYYAGRTLEDSVILREAQSAQLLSELGIGAKFHGIFKDGSGRWAFAMDIVPGTFDGNPVRAQTFTDLETMLGRLEGAGITSTGDFQAHVNKDGRMLAIDPGGIADSVGRPPVYAPNSKNGDFTRERVSLLFHADAEAAGVPYLQRLKTSNPEAWQGVVDSIQFNMLHSRRLRTSYQKYAPYLEQNGIDLGGPEWKPVNP